MVTFERDLGFSMTDHHPAPQGHLRQQGHWSEGWERSGGGVGEGEALAARTSLGSLGTAYDDLMVEKMCFSLSPA